ncbi:MAG: tyrosine-type recombinase/integrase [Kiritimatiellae bacterium]|nr:tyrosine-type recombinase/integrase [Kiritimatiellia bacterium]MCO5068568.1 tyrosine-type recombinase/integrase [Kiritimatiellia bacterium]
MTDTLAQAGGKSADLWTVEPFRAYRDHLRRLNRSVHTIDVHGYALGTLHRLLDEDPKRLRDVTAAEVEGYRVVLLERGLHPTTISIHLFAWRSFFRWMEKSGRIFLDPTKDLIVGHPKRSIGHVPTEKDVRALLAQPDLATPYGIRDRALLEVAYSTAARLQELTAATVLDVDLSRGTLRVLGKGRKERLAPLGAKAVFWLRRYLREARPKLVGPRPDETALWISLRHASCTPGAVERIFSGYARKAGLRRISPHALRRACATHMLRRGAHPVQLQFLLGHASLNNLSHYLQVSILDLRKMHRSAPPGR